MSFKIPLENTVLVMYEERNDTGVVPYGMRIIQRKNILFKRKQ